MSIPVRVEATGTSYEQRVRSRDTCYACQQPRLVVMRDLVLPCGGRIRVGLGGACCAKASTVYLAGWETHWHVDGSTLAGRVWKDKTMACEVLRGWHPRAEIDAAAGEVRFPALVYRLRACSGTAS